jgi:hypothetical protein
MNSCHFCIYFAEKTSADRFPLLADGAAYCYLNPQPIIRDAQAPRCQYYKSEATAYRESLFPDTTHNTNKEQSK